MKPIQPRTALFAASLMCAFVIDAQGLAAAQQPTSAQANAIRQSCRSDYMKHCSSVPTGGEASLACLREHASEVSSGCQQALRAVSGGPTTAKPPAKAASVQGAPSASSPSWPHTIVNDRGSAVVYQPQAISWPDRHILNTRIALALTPAGAKAATLGTIEVAFTTFSDLASRTVTLTSPRLTAVKFPASAPEQTQRFEQAIRATLETMGDKRFPLDTILLSLDGDTQSPPEAAVKNDPPAIFYSARPASLLVFDGEPVLAPVGSGSLSVAVNTNWDVFVDPSTKTWYWLNNGAWLTAPNFKGPWRPVTRLPAPFSSLPSDANFATVKKQIPGRNISTREMPTVFVSTLPAEVIVTQGTPLLVPITGTSLSYVSNTDANLFVANGRYFYLVAGRWYSAMSLDGPWTYATPNLPADFARIPPSSARGYVLVSVPGTRQAQDAVMQTMIPTQATLDRSATKLEIIYSGEPKFEPIAGTEMMHAVNTMHDVIKVGDKYYACYQAAWFVAPSPAGAWVLASSVPTVIYTIPPSNPLYRVTFVKVYGNTESTVTFGYTTGYTMSYVSSGVVVYGTGYYYAPVIWPATIPIYYPYPYTWSGSTWYNPNTGAWARGGTIYGPAGGAASGGTVYNPNTGAWAHGGAVYGPNGGAGAWSGYNPSTGGYMHGSASWGTNSGTANMNWYNGRTGVTGSTNQNYNQYGSWGASTFSGANKTVNTQHQSNAQGSAGSFKSSTGAEGAGVKGAGGNSAGAVKTSGGDVYAGADGNVYKKTSDGWSKWDDGSWNSVQPPTNSSQGSRQQNLSGQTQQSATNSNQGSRQQNLSGQTQRSTTNSHQGSGQQNLSGQTRQSSALQNASGESAQGRSQNLSGETERGSGLRQRSASEGSGFQQLDRDRFARTEGSARQQGFTQGGATRGGGGRLRR